MEPSHQAASQTTLSVYHTVRKPKLDRWKEKGGRVGGRECVCLGWGVDGGNGKANWLRDREGKAKVYTVPELPVGLFSKT